LGLSVNYSKTQKSRLKYEKFALKIAQKVKPKTPFGDFLGF